MTATALGSFTAAVALLAGMSGAAAQTPASQTPAPGASLSGAGSFPGSFIVPGTNTSFKAGAVIELDMNYDSNSFSANPSDGGLYFGGLGNVPLQGNGEPGYPGGAPISALPGVSHSDHGVFYMSPANSRLNIETRTPTAYGELKTYIEIGFGGSIAASNVTAGTETESTGNQQNTENQQFDAALQQAYGTLGPWLFGMTWSTYADLAAWPDTLDGAAEAGNYMTIATVRIPQIRYTYLFPNGISEAVALENAVPGGIVAGTNPTSASTGLGPGGASVPSDLTWNAFSAPSYSIHVPSIVSMTRVDQPWGHAAFHIAVMQERFKNEAASAESTSSTTGDTELFTYTDSGDPVGDAEERWGYQMAFSGHLNTIGTDKMTWSIGYGQGAAWYSGGLTSTIGSQYTEGLVCTTNGPTPYSSTNTSLTCSQPRALGVNASYTHVFTDQWRASVSGGYDQESRPAAAAEWDLSALAALSRKEYSEGAALFWTPTAGAQFGLGLAHYEKTVWSGAHGNETKFLSQALLQF